ncbi:TerB family tellurite resistance protein [Flavisolibacter sp. BT320]|nr:TerB family tellurite resistance protein [Flavisolibacter longurius]
MYREKIYSADQALVHLAYHCCLKDGEMQPEELDLIATSFVAKGVNKNLDLKEEMKAYQSYAKDLTDETTFLIFLISTISPKYKLALFAFCADIIYRNHQVTMGEEILLHKLAGLLYITETESTTLQRFIHEMYLVEKANQF